MKQNYTVITHAPEVGIYSSTYVVAENNEEAIKRAISDFFFSVYEELLN